MAIKAYDSAPYYDDYNVQDAQSNNKTVDDKGYLKILFKPGYSVQVRELNQMQSMLQGQIDKFGRSVYKDGPVLEGVSTFQDKLDYIDVDIADDNKLGSNNVTTKITSQLSLLKGMVLEGRTGENASPAYAAESTKPKAEILGYKLVQSNTTGSVGNYRYRFFVRYVNSGGASPAGGNQKFVSPNNENTYSASADQLLAFSTTFSSGSSASLQIGAGLPIGRVAKVGDAASITVDRGIFFGKGQFMFSDEIKTIYITKPNTNKVISGRFVFKLIETAKSFANDATLNDNSNGTPNYQAPGADRYEVTLSPMFLINSTTDKDILPSSKTISGQAGTGDALNTEVDVEASSNSTTNYVTLMNVGASVALPPATPQYSDIDDKLAVRTYEESGDYVVNPFRVAVQEHLNDNAGNNGRYLSSDTPAGNEAKYVVAVEPGVAYVKGYRAENTSKLELIQDKARTEVSTFSTSSITQAMGNFIEVDIQTASGRLPLMAPNQKFTFCNADDEDGIGGTNMPTSGEGAVTCRIRAIEKVASLGTNGRYRVYIYDLRSNGTGAGEIPRGATRLVGEDARSGTDADGCILTLTESNTSNPTPIFNSSESESIIELPETSVSDIDQAASTVTELVTSQETISGTSHTLTVSSPRLFHSDSVDSYIVIENNAGEQIPVTNVSGAGTTSVTLTLDNSHSGTLSSTACTVISSQTVGLGGSGLARCSKTLGTVTTAETLNVKITGGYTTSATTTSTAHAVGDILELDNYDVYEITEVQKGDGTVLANTAATIPNFVELDTGMRDGQYIKSRVIVKSAQTGLKLKYKYLIHGASGVYFDAKSYPSDFYASIPEYNGIKLSDVLDFRRKDDQSDGVILDPNNAAKISLKYYQERIDKLAVTTTGDFIVINGTPSRTAQSPEVPKDAMVLYDFFVPAFTNKVTDIKMTPIDNRRYTMRDIGDLEHRISNLEYYTTLSLLEREATGKQITQTESDGTISERFKNGIIVDSFLTQGIGDAQDSGFSAAYDLEDGNLRASFTDKNVRLAHPSGTPTNAAKDDTGSNVIASKFDRTTVTGNTSTDGLGDYLIMPFTEEVLIEQNQASMHMSVNPYDMATWNGVIELSPSSDEWRETERRPDVAINLNSGVDAVANLINGNKAMNTVWNSWEIVGRGKARRQRGRRGRSANVGVIHRRETVNTQRFKGQPKRRYVVSQRIDEMRTGIKLEANVNKVEQNIGDRVVDISFIPFIRSRKIYFKASLLKPNTRMYAFFDKQDVTQYCSKETFVEYKNSPETGKSTLGATHYSVGGNQLSSRVELVTDANGALEGYFVIPENDTLRFRTGLRKFKLADSSTNDLASITTSAETEYTAQGVIQTVEGQIISTRQLTLDEERLSQDRSGVFNIEKTEYYDPLAQSFIIGNIPTGCFTTSIDLFFQAKSSNVPLSVHLVTVENGIPTQKIVPKSKVVKLPSEVNISATAATATKFDFKDPIYLAPGVEYAIVVMSNSPDYHLWLSETGGTDVTTSTLISKNTYAGVSFKSQNASTWTPDQSKDFKFTIRRAKFTNSAGTAGTESVPVTQKYMLQPMGLSGGDPLKFSVLQLITEELLLDGTDISYTLGLADVDFSILSNQNMYFEGLKEMTGAGTSGSGNGHLDITFTSTSEFISPVIDMERVSLVGIEHVIASKATSIGASNDFGDAGDTELSATHGGATARYITKEVKLNNAANQINIIFGANRPSSDTNVAVYVRTQADGRIQDKTFTHVPPKDGTEVFINSSGNVKDSEFVHTSTDLFNSFQVKVVFTSENTAESPLITDFRAIATT